MSFKIVYLMAALIVTAIPFSMAQFGDYKTSSTTNGGMRLAVFTNGTILCDTLQCPSQSDKCTIFRNTTSDLSSIYVRKTCWDNNNVSLKKDESTIVNPRPGNYVHDFASVDQSGNNYQCSSCNGANETEIEQNLVAQLQNMNDNLNQLFNQSYPAPPAYPSYPSGYPAYPAYPSYPPGYGSYPAPAYPSYPPGYGSYPPPPPAPPAPPAFPSFPPGFPFNY